MEAPKNAYAVILAGGGGTRLWPLSRQKRPKHLVNIVGKETIIRSTLNRILPLIPIERVLVITREDQAELVKKELPEVPEENIIREPEGKNTALAMGTAAAFVYKRDPEGVITYLAADHIIRDEEKYRRIVAAALEVAAEDDYLVAVGIRPTFAHTGLGYIKLGEDFESKGSGGERLYVFKSQGFKEKPDLVTAQSFIATGKYLWNANLYNWSAKSIFKAFEKHAPELSRGIKRILESDDPKVLAEVYAEAENVPIDIAVSEKVDNLVVIPGDFGWSDVGDWKVVYDTLGKDELGNVVEAEEFLQLETYDSLIESEGRLIVTIGVENLMIIDSEDALLICNKYRTQDVKKIVEKLKELKKDKYL